MRTLGAPLDLFLPVRDPAIDALHAATACYTRDTVVDAVLDLAGWPGNGGLLLDPGTGDGAFLERAISRLTLERNDIEALAHRVEGWEIHPDAAHDARLRVAHHLVHGGWAHSAAEDAAHLVMIEADFLAPGPVERRYSVICGNPPYLRSANLPERFKALYAETVPDYARADILHAFLDRCTNVLTDDGVLACVTSYRWLFNQNAGKLRESIGQRFGISEIVRLDPASSFYRPKHRIRAIDN
ncbi:MAG: Eco57I restriction-modification methylase domain-containing protein [Gemmatimonadaceae bacterium]